MDIWEDLDTLRFLQHGEYPPQVTSSHRDRIQQHYSWKDDHLVRCLPQGDRKVPPPHEQPGLIQKINSELGHFGIKYIDFLFFVTIGEVCMFKFETSLLGVNNVIE